ncbi:MAG: T9SS C-terminal target domain-containing protein [Burkholderiales bacterium]|nr:MAG: T9SS C-terminal target domain-containing protein [Burkholderiales bacterium]
MSIDSITDPCNYITDITNFKWKNISFPSGSVYDTYGETMYGQNVSFHLPDKESYTIEFSFTVITNCGSFTFSRNFNVDQEYLEVPCEGCTSSFCYEQTFCFGQALNEPFFTRVDWILFSGNQQFIVFGPGHQNYNGPYYFYGGGVCQFTPNMQDMIDDLNVFLDSQHTGHAILKYYDSNDPGYNGCKIRIRVRESDLMMEYIQAYSGSFDLPCPSAEDLDSTCNSNIYPLEESTLCQSNDHTIRNFDPAIIHQILEDKNKEDFYSPVFENEFSTVIKPNVSKNSIDINIQSLSLSNYLVEVIDLSGKPINSQFIIKAYQSQKIDVSDLPSGMYLVRIIQLESGTIEFERFFKI